MHEPPRVDVPADHLTAGVVQQLILYAALLPSPFALSQHALGDGHFLGLSDATWLLVAVAVPVAHQALVVVGWRLQLRYRLLTRWFGGADLAVWGALFLPLLVARPLTILALGLADAGSAGAPWLLSAALGAGLALPALHTLWSVHRYFGIPRALGGDHFREAYRSMPMVTEGAFGWSANAMYTFAFLGLWSIALLTNSWAALAACLFQHAAIWVHWYGTEKPDIELLYG